MCFIFFNIMNWYTVNQSSSSSPSSNKNRKKRRRKSKTVPKKSNRRLHELIQKGSPKTGQKSRSRSGYRGKESPMMTTTTTTTANTRRSVMRNKSVITKPTTTANTRRSTTSKPHKITPLKQGFSIVNLCTPSPKPSDPSNNNQSRSLTPPSPLCFSNVTSDMGSTNIEQQYMDKSDEVDTQEVSVRNELLSSDQSRRGDQTIVERDNNIQNTPMILNANKYRIQQYHIQTNKPKANCGKSRLLHSSNDTETVHKNNKKKNNNDKNRNINISENLAESDHNDDNDVICDIRLKYNDQGKMIFNYEKQTELLDDVSVANSVHSGNDQDLDMLDDVSVPEFQNDNNNDDDNVGGSGSSSEATIESNLLVVGSFNGRSYTSREIKQYGYSTFVCLHFNISFNFVSEYVQNIC